MKTTELKKIIRKIFRKKPTKLSWPMSAKSDTQLPGFIYNEIGIFWIASSGRVIEKVEEIKENIKT